MKITSFLESFYRIPDQLYDYHSLVYAQYGNRVPCQANDNRTVRTRSYDTLIRHQATLRNLRTITDYRPVIQHMWNE